MVDSYVYDYDCQSFRYGYIIAAYNNIVYKLARAQRSDSTSHQKRFLARKREIEMQISEHEITAHLNPHLRRCIGKMDMVAAHLPNHYKSKEEVRQQFDEENYSNFNAKCTKQESQKSDGLADPSAGIKSVHDATLGPDDRCFIFCYD